MVEHKREEDLLYDPKKSVGGLTFKLSPKGNEDTNYAFQEEKMTLAKAVSWDRVCSFRRIEVSE